MKSQASGQAPKPSKAMIRAGSSKPPAILGVSEHAASFIEHAGGTAAKSAGHIAHDAIHLAKKLNPFG